MSNRNWPLEKGAISCTDNSWLITQPTLAWFRIMYFSTWKETVLHYSYCLCQVLFWASWTWSHAGPTGGILLWKSGGCTHKGWIKYGIILAVQNWMSLLPGQKPTVLFFTTDPYASGNGCTNAAMAEQAIVCISPSGEYLHVMERLCLKGLFLNLVAPWWP